MPSKRKTVPADNSSDHLAMRYYQLGCRLKRRDFITDADFRSLAGQFALPATSATWYKSIQFARKFEHTESWLLNIVQLRVGQRRITLSHLDELIRLPTARQRERFAALALRRNLSCLALRAEIRKKRGWKSGRVGAGRTLKDPVSEAHAVLRARREIKRLKTTLCWLEDKSLKSLSVRLRKALVVAVQSVEVLEKSLIRSFRET